MIVALETVITVLFCPIIYISSAADTVVDNEVTLPLPFVNFSLVIKMT